MALISAFAAGSAVGFAVRNQMAKKQEHRLEIELDQVTASVDTITNRLQSHAFLNALDGLAAQDMATAALIAYTIDRTANYYTGSNLTTAGTKEKHITEAIKAIKANRSKPLSEDKNLEAALYQNCLLYTSPSPRDLSTSRMPSSA